VYGIVKQASGDVLIYSEPEVGTTIWINVPVTLDERSEPRDARPFVPWSEAGETVLLVEDEEIVRESVRRMLEEHGYTMLVAATADDALAILRAHPYRIDLLLTDVVIPGRSGRELSTEVAELRPETKVLFMSGYSPEVIANEGLAKEFCLIEKPFSADDLLRKFREASDGDS
jgi:DNA-binding NtrC family response regulator